MNENYQDVIGFHLL